MAASFLCICTKTSSHFDASGSSKLVSNCSFIEVLGCYTSSLSLTVNEGTLNTLLFTVILRRTYGYGLLASQRNSAVATPWAILSIDSLFYFSSSALAGTGNSSMDPTTR